MITEMEKDNGKHERNLSEPNQTGKRSPIPFTPKSGESQNRSHQQK